MAKDPNEKDRPVNGVDTDTYAEEHEAFMRKASRIFDIAANIEVGVKPYSKEYKRHVEERRVAAEQLAYAQSLGLPNGVVEQELTKDIVRHDDFIKKQQTIAQESAQRRMSTALGRELSPGSVNGQVARLSKESIAQQSGLSMMGMSPKEIEEKIAISYRNLSTIGREAQAVNKVAWEPGGTMSIEGAGDFVKVSKSYQEEVNNISALRVAQSFQKQLGKDPASILSRHVKQYGEAQAIEQMRGITSSKQFEVRSGEALGVGASQMVSGSGLSRGLEKELGNLKQIIDKLGDSSKKSAEEIKELTEKQEQSSKRAEDIRQAISARQERLSNYAGAAQLLGGAFSAMGNLQMELNVNQPLAREQNRRGLAEWENQRYDAYRRARAGDYEAQISLGLMNEAETFGSDLRGSTQKAQIAQILAGSAQATAGGFQMAAAGGSAFGGVLTGNLGNAVQTGQAGLSQTVGGVVNTVVTGSDMLQGITATQIELQARQSRLATDRAIIRNNAIQVQGFRDYGVGAGMASLQLGATRGEAFMNQAVSDENMNSMIASRMSPEQFNKISQMGISQMGSTFSIDQVYTAQNLSRVFGTAEQGTQNMARLSAAGANNPKEALGSVLEASFSKSLEGSKVLNMMVENTAALAQQSGVGAALGLDVTSASAKLLAGGIDTSIPNKELAIDRAMTAREFAQDIRSGTGTGFADMISTARLQDTMGISNAEAIAAQGVDDVQLKSLMDMQKKGDVSGISRYFGSIGVNTAGKTPQQIGQMVSSLEEGKFKSALMIGGTGLATISSENQDILYKNRSRLAELSKDPNSIKDKSLQDAVLQFNLGTTLATKNKVLGYELAGANQSLAFEPNDAGQAKKNEAMAGKGAGKLQEDAFKMATSGFTQMSEAAKQGATAFGDAKKAFEALTRVSNDLEKNAAEYEKKAGTAAKSAADRPTLLDDATKAAATAFEKSSETILEAAKVFANTMGVKLPTAGAKSQNNMNKKK